MVGENGVEAARWCCSPRRYRASVTDPLAVLVAPYQIYYLSMRFGCLRKGTIPCPEPVYDDWSTLLTPHDPLDIEPLRFNVSDVPDFGPRTMSRIHPYNPASRLVVAMLVAGLD